MEDNYNGPEYAHNKQIRQLMKERIVMVAIIGILAGTATYQIVERNRESESRADQFERIADYVQHLEQRAKVFAAAQFPRSNDPVAIEIAEASFTMGAVDALKAVK